MVRSLRRPPVQGSADPDVPGHVLVPVKKKPDGFPAINYSVPETSFWRVHTRSNKPVAIVTVTPSGLNLGWDECGNCAHGLLHCTCQLGISLPRSIEYIWVTSGGKKPLPQPNAVRFQQPVPVERTQPKRKLKRYEPQLEVKKRPLRRLRREEIATTEAKAAVGRPLRKLVK